MSGTFAQYKATRGHNWSKVKAMADSALAYKYGLDHDREDTPALALGRAVHTLVFEPDNFGSEYAIFGGAVRKGKEWDAFAADNEGRTIFKQNEIEQAREMAAAVRANPLVKPYLTGAVYEKVVTWTDPATGLQCKAKLDYARESDLVIADLKTTTSIAPRRFAADIAKFKYHGQMGHYGNGVRHGLGWTPTRVLLIAVEKSAPYDVAVYEMDDAGKECGKELAATLLERIKWCEERNVWPGAQFDWDTRTLTETTLELPGWLYGGDVEITFDSEE